MKILFLLAIWTSAGVAIAQSVPVDLSKFKKSSGVSLGVEKNNVALEWPGKNGSKSRILLCLDNGAALFKNIQVQNGGAWRSVGADLDPAFLLTIGKRDLVSQNGWNIFFDKVHLKPYHSQLLKLKKQSVKIKSEGSRTIVAINEMTAMPFKGYLEITLYNGAGLFNIAAVMATPVDSTAILYDAALVSRKLPWPTIQFSDVLGNMQKVDALDSDSATNNAVKYRTIIGENKEGSMAVFPAPHQYFYPLDEAFNLKFTWHGRHYRGMIDDYGIGIRQALNGDDRFVPWFNAPPGTKQRLNFFCLVSDQQAAGCLDAVKQYTNSDSYAPLPGYKTLASHFHNEYIMKELLSGKAKPAPPAFIGVFKKAGIDIVHLGEFHGVGDPKGPDEKRLPQLKALFEQCSLLSDKDFLLLPGEEPNNFFGGHWLAFFPKPVYWVMSRKPDEKFVSEVPDFGKVYHIGNAAEMLELLKLEKGLAWTAHPRTKGSTDYPDKYKDEFFFKDDHFFGAAWKPLPADLSEPRLGKRVLDLLDDMNNWGYKKKIIAESDIFTVEHENEMYAHLNVNYIRANKLPGYKDGWQSILDALSKGRFFSTTGEVLIPSFTINKMQAGDLASGNLSKAVVSFSLKWTFPLQFAEIISGDGVNVYRHKIELTNTLPFGTQNFTKTLNLANRKWARLEVWDAASNGAFTQTIWLKN